MSTRSEVTRQKLLKLRKDDNNKCADCNTLGTIYIDIKLGCWLCTRCASFHRKLGTDISRIKSISFDTFKDSDVNFIKSVGGNRNFNLIYEAHDVFSYPKMTSDSNDTYAHTYIIKKYVDKLFYDESKKRDKIKRSNIQILSPQKIYKETPIQTTKDTISKTNDIFDITNKIETPIDIFDTPYKPPEKTYEDIKQDIMRHYIY